MSPTISIKQQGWDEALQNYLRNYRDMKPRMRHIVLEVSREVRLNIKTAMPVRTGAAKASWGTRNAKGIWIEDDGGMTVEQGSTLGYIQYLNEGSSRQAPAGFIDAQVQYGEAKLIHDMENTIMQGIGFIFGRG